MTVKACYNQDSSMEDCDDGHNNGVEPPEFEVTLLEPRPFRPFKSSEEYLYAMKEDLAEWLTGLYEGLYLDADNFLEQMETGVILCQHANNVVRKAREYYRSGGRVLSGAWPIPVDRDVFYRGDVLPETFPARDNVSNFISWCRSLRIKECLLFETDDLVLRKNERSFILCLLEVARRGVQVGLPAPLLVQLEQEIDAEMAADNSTGGGYAPPIRQQVVTNDLRSLHERVVELLSRCTCPSQFPMIRVADGKYRIGDTKVLIFVRILRSHVMVRVGGGWDTLEHYLDKHDPCRCRSGHRLATSAKLTMVAGKSSIPSMHVTYNRPSQAPSSTPSSPQNPRRTPAHMSPTPSRRLLLLRSSSSEEEPEQGRDGSPSAWRYAPGRGANGNSRLPALTPRPPENKQPPKQVGKVSPRPHYQPNWSETRSQSSEDLFQAPASGPAQPPQGRNNLVFHSRGTSPVNTARGRVISPPTDHAFRRNDPKRHSSPRINQRGSYTKMQLSPPKVRTTPTPSRRMFWSPERTQRTPLVRKNSAPSSEKSSPVLERLMQHSELCSNKSFLIKIEQLIAEFQAETKLLEEENSELQFHSLPVGVDCHTRKSPPMVECGKSPSKIPLPTWYPKCRT